jgi:peptidoglycan/LPS O-acetylase OafA/YrhL
MPGTMLRSQPPVVQSPSSSPPAAPPRPVAPPAANDAPAWLAGGHIPSLDGLRALSIVLVLAAHAGLTIVPDRTGPFAWVPTLGGLGVDTFFVISGFLITLLLVRERERYGTVSLRAFYIRRGFRILPAYVVFLAGLGLLSAAGTAVLTGRDWFGALTYTVNFLPHTSWPVGHIWSLSVEEHFYLLWPLVLWLLPPRQAGVLAGVCVVGAPLVRLAITRLAPGTLDVDYCTPARLDTIAVGCLLALIAADPAGRRLLPRLSGRRAAVAAVLLAGAVLVSRFVLARSATYQLLFHRTAVAACLAGIVWAGVSCPRGPLGRILDAAPLVWLGRLSYSVYLWQQPFINPRSDAWVCQWPVNLVLALAVALASYYLVERPFLRLREVRGWGRVGG